MFKIAFFGIVNSAINNVSIIYNTSLYLLTFVLFRVLSLQLLSRLCDLSNGHKQVSDALSMLRLRFGEPVRFKFLVGMLNSYNSDVFQVRFDVLFYRILIVLKRRKKISYRSIPIFIFALHYFICYI